MEKRPKALDHFHQFRKFQLHLMVALTRRRDLVHQFEHFKDLLSGDFEIHPPQGCKWGELQFLEQIDY